ncbi:MAG: DJ-1/PfpI family protein [Bacteroidota bacterium]
MRAAYLLFNDLTLLDFIGFYDPMSRLQSQGHLPDFTWHTCAMTPTVKDHFGLEIRVDKVRPDLAGYDLLFVPGGFGTRQLQYDQAFLTWLQTGASVPLKTSVCTGSLLLGAAGFLTERSATTHFNAYEGLVPYCKEVVRKEVIVEDSSVITAGAVASSLELGLYLCDKLVGPNKTERIRKSMAYRSTSFNG